MPVWGVWIDGGLWFSSSLGSRKTRNLLARPSCVVTTDAASAPVVLEGEAELITDPERLAQLLAAENTKYGTDYGPDLLDPAVNAAFRITPRAAFGLIEEDFTGSPTRWLFA